MMVPVEVRQHPHVSFTQIDQYLRPLKLVSLCASSLSARNRERAGISGIPARATMTRAPPERLLDVGSFEVCSEDVGIARRFSVAAMSASDPAGRHVADQTVSFFGGPLRVFSALRLAPADLRVLPAAPVDHQHDISCGVIDVEDDLFDERAHETRLGVHVGGRGVPRGREIIGELTAGA
jgi:hypothetical protein